MKKFLSTGQKKYPDEAKKSRKRMIRMKEQQIFFAGRRQKNAGKETGRNKKIYQAYPEKA